MRKTFIHRVLGGGAALLLALTFAAGCGGDSGGPDPKAEQARLEQAKTYRSYFDKVQGDYTKLTVEDRDAYLKLCGGNEDEGKRIWNLMKYGPGGGPGGPGPRNPQGK